MSWDSKVSQRDEAYDRREGSRIVIVTGPRGQLYENLGFYRNIGQIHMALGFSDSYVVGQEQYQSRAGEAIPDELLTKLALSIGPATVIVADLTAPCEIVVANLQFARGLGAHAIILINPGQRLPRFVVDEQMKFDGELMVVTKQRALTSTIIQVGKVVNSFLLTAKSRSLQLSA
ncbi:MAG: hypothetical protein NVSMB66_3210 [Candidatus Doudnabacteria bacterium]